MAAFRERFNKAPPQRATQLNWEKRAFALGSVKDRLRSGRKTTRLETCPAVVASIERSPMKSTRKRSSELGVPWSTCETTWKTWMWGRIAQLSWMNCRMATWIGAMNLAMLCWTHSQMPYPAERFFSVTNVPSIAVRATEMWCSGQRRIPISRRSCNIIHRMWWYGWVWHQIIGLDLIFSMDRWMRHLIRNCWRRGSYLSWETENSWMTCGCSTMGHPHTSLSLRDVLNEHFPGRWIGRGSPTSPSPLPWPPHSPDLTTPENSLWGIIKARVAARRYNNNEDLRRAVEDTFCTITPKMLLRMSQRTWRRIRLCVQHQGHLQEDKLYYYSIWYRHTGNMWTILY